MTEKKKHYMMTALIVLMMAAMMIFTAGCAAETEEPKNDILETESGWTIEDDGSYTYACIIKNTSEDKMISSCALYVDGLDADGNVMEKLPEWEGAGAMVGAIMPGEKAAVVEDRFTSSDPMSREWETTPSAFSFKVGGKRWLDPKDKAAKVFSNIHIVSAEQTYNEDDLVSYEVVIENKGEEDIDVDFTGAGDYLFKIVAVFRDEDGNITGGSDGVLQSFDDVITLPAGEEVKYEVAFNGVPKGEPELILTWN